MLKIFKNKKLAVVGFLLMFVFIFFRENVLLIINAFISDQNTNRAYSYWFSDIFQSLTKDQLYLSKWVVSFLFTFLTALLTVFTLHQWFKNNSFTKIIITIYLATSLLTLAVGLIGYFSVGFFQVYPFLRRVFGIIHSPVPFFLFFLLFYLKNKETSSLN